MKRYWLVKSEPFVYSFARLQEEGKGVWDGVRNYQARNNLRAMAVDDPVLFYHSNEGLEVVGIAKVITTAFPDPTAEKGDWSAVELVPVKAFTETVPLQAIKQQASLSEIALVRNGRLSVMPLTESEFFEILKMGKTVYP